MIVVTGGAGFIGSNLVHALNRRGERRIVIVDRLDHGDKFLNLNALAFVDFVDFGDETAVAELCASAEAVFHLGACTDTTETDGRYMVENNFTCSKRLLGAAAAHQVPFIYASSAAVYGTGELGFVEEPACERSLNVYAASKQMLDNHVRELLLACGPRPRSPVVGLRYFNVYGPQEAHKGRMASVAFHLFGQLRESGTMRLFEGSRGFLRDFVHVDDAVAVTLELFDRGVSGIFNCGTGKGRSFHDVATILSALEGGKGEITFVEFPAELVGKYQAHTEADLTRVRAAGCEHVFVALEEGLRRYHRALTGSAGYLTR